MQLTRQTEYAIRILIELGSVPPGEMIQSRIVAEKEEIPEKFLKKTIQVLVRAGLVETRRGMQGGVKLAVPLDSITIADVITAIEGRVAINPCLANGYYCRRRSTCRVRHILERGQKALLDELGKETLAELAGEQETAESPVSGS